jgi:hypothetical protein
MDQDFPLVSTVLEKPTTSIFREPAEDWGSRFVWNTDNHLSAYLVSKTQTALWIFTTVKTWNKEPKDIRDQSVDS